MDPKCSYMRFFAICQLLIVSQVSAKLETKWGFFSKNQPYQVILISSLQAWMIVMMVSSVFCGYMYICQFFFLMSLLYSVCPEYIHTFLGLFLRTPLPPKLSGNSNKLHKVCQKIFGSCRTLTQTPRNSNPFCGGGRRQYGYFLELHNIFCQ